MNHLSWAPNDKWTFQGYQGGGTELQVEKNQFFFSSFILSTSGHLVPLCAACCSGSVSEVRIHQGIMDERGSVPRVWSKWSSERTVLKSTLIHTEEDLRKTLLWEKNHQRAVWTRGKKRCIWQGSGGGSVSSETMVRGWLLSFACGFGAVT